MSRSKRQRTEEPQASEDPETELGETIEIGKAFQWASRQYHLTYKTHLPFNEIEDLIRNTFKPADIDSFSAVHETSDKGHGYEHTHVYFCLSFRVKKRGPLLDFGDIHPNVKKVSGPQHARAIFEYHKKAPISLKQYGLNKIASQGSGPADAWKEVCDLAQQARSDPSKLIEIREKHPQKWMLCQKSIKADAQEVPPVKELTSTLNFWFFGPKNTGKSQAAKKLALELFPGEKPFFKDPANKWWDNYTGQSCVIIEEFCPENGKYASSWKRILDIYPVIVEKKGSSCEIRPKMIIITSNYEPKDCFNETDLGPICARVRVREFTQVYCEFKATDEELLAKADALLGETVKKVDASARKPRPFMKVDVPDTTK